MFPITGKDRVIIFLALLCCAFPVRSDDGMRRYRTLEERREAGQVYQITNWLSVSPFIELEYLRQNQQSPGLNDQEYKENSKTLQFDIELTPLEWINAEIVYEYDDELNEFVLEEAGVELEWHDTKFEAGRINLPFGEYYSRFVTGPALEFGEITARSFLLAYETEAEAEFSIFVYQSKFEQQTSSGDGFDWGWALELKPHEHIIAGVSYLSDLAESDDRILDDLINYQSRVDALALFVNYEYEDFDASLEYLKALKKFSELDEDRNQPSAWNLELGIFVLQDLELAFRFEAAKELEDEADQRYGLVITSHAMKNVTATIEYLIGEYKPGLAEDVNGNEMDKQSFLAAQFGISF